MRLTTKGRYAVTAILDLALHGGTMPVALADIARRQNLSLSYLEQLFTRLKKRGLVSAARGPGGGYRLAQPAESVSVAQVIAAVDEGVDATRCGGERNCQADGKPCLTHDLWAELTAHIHGYLSGVTLADVIARNTDRKQRHTHPLAGHAAPISLQRLERRGASA